MVIRLMIFKDRQDVRSLCSSQRETTGSDCLEVAKAHVLKSHGHEDKALLIGAGVTLHEALTAVVVGKGIKVTRLFERSLDQDLRLSFLRSTAFFTNAFSKLSRHLSSKDDTLHELSSDTLNKGCLYFIDFN